MKMHFFITDLTSALTFLTRLRLPGFLMAETPAGARAAWAYPLAGAIATIIPALVLAGFAWLAAPPLIYALLASLVSIMISGGLHEDGLTDTADGFFGGRNRESVLSIMKDRRLWRHRHRSLRPVADKGTCGADQRDRFSAGPCYHRLKPDIRTT